MSVPHLLPSGRVLEVPDLCWEMEGNHEIKTCSFHQPDLPSSVTTQLGTTHIQGFCKEVSNTPEKDQEVSLNSRRICSVPSRLPALPPQPEHCTQIRTLRSIHCFGERGLWQSAQHKLLLLASCLSSQKQQSQKRKATNI